MSFSIDFEAPPTLGVLGQIRSIIKCKSLYVAALCDNNDVLLTPRLKDAGSWADFLEAEAAAEKCTKILDMPCYVVFVFESVQSAVEQEVAK